MAWHQAGDCQVTIKTNSGHPNVLGRKIYVSKPERFNGRPLIVITIQRKAYRFTDRKKQALLFPLSSDEPYMSQWTRSSLFILIGPLGTNFSENPIEYNFLQDNVFANALCKISAALFCPQCVDALICVNNTSLEENRKKISRWQNKSYTSAFCHTVRPCKYIPAVPLTK